MPRKYSPDFCTSDSLTQIAGVCRATLLNWVKVGLLPPGRSSGGRGSIAKYPIAALDVVREIQRLRTLKYGLSEIRSQLEAKFPEFYTFDRPEEVIRPEAYTLPPQRLPRPQRNLARLEARAARARERADRLEEELAEARRQEEKPLGRG